MTAGIRTSQISAVIPMSYVHCALVFVSLPSAYEVNGTRTQLISPVLKLTWNESSPRGFAECLQMPLTGRAEEPAHISKAIEIPSETTDFQENVGRRSLTPFDFSFWCR